VSGIAAYIIESVIFDLPFQIYCGQ